MHGLQRTLQLAAIFLGASGAALAQPLAAGQPKFLGGIYSQSQAVNFTQYFNQVAPENAGKWGSVEATRDVMNWTELDAARDLAKSNGFPFRFHVLVWGNQQPNWIAGLSQAEQLEEITEWFEEVAARYGADIDYLEVVNEPTNDPPDGAEDGGYINALGTSTGATPAARWNWVVNAFKLARQKFPASTKFMVNEFNVTNGGKLTQYLELIDELKAENLVDVVGIQAHSFSTTISFTPSNVTIANLNAIAAKGLPLMVTEMDIDGGTDAANNDQIQLSEYQRIFPIFWEHPSVIGITLWGYRPGLWRNAQAAYLVRADGSERPALTWLREYLVPDAPVIAGGQSFAVVQGWENGRAIGTVRATDGDAGTTFSGWTITGGTGASVFAINASTGQLTLSNAGALNASATPSYTLNVRVSDGVNTSETGTVTVNVLPVGSATTRLVALAARAAAGSGDQTLIMGVVVDGEKQVLVRGVGPGIAKQGVTTALADPELELNRMVGGVPSPRGGNNDWETTTEMLAAFARTGAAALDAGSKDAALLTEMSGSPGVYTAHVTSRGAAGVALVDAFDAGGSGRLVALATRAVAGAGDDTLIAGLALGGNGPKTVLIRALGPTLASRDGVGGVLPDPKLTLYRAGVSEARSQNEDWGGTAELKSAFAAVGAGPLASDTSKDAALLVTLDPGAYTVHVTGAAGTTGVALVEIFDVP